MMLAIAQDTIAMAERMASRAQLPARSKVERLQAEMAQFPQATGLVTEHYFIPGAYCRKLSRKADTLIVGKVHKAPHFFLCAAGEILVLDGETVKTMKAGDVIECKPGTKRATYAVVDSVGITMHLTGETDLDKIEAELIEPDEAALFDASNQIKALLENAK